MRLEAEETELLAGGLDAEGLAQISRQGVLSALCKGQFGVLFIGQFVPHFSVFVGLPLNEAG